MIPLWLGGVLFIVGMIAGAIIYIIFNEKEE